VFFFVLNNLPHQKRGEKVVEKMCKNGLKIVMIFKISCLKFDSFLNFPQLWKKGVKNGAL